MPGQLAISEAMLRLEEPYYHNKVKQLLESVKIWTPGTPLPNYMAGT